MLEARQEELYEAWCREAAQRHGVPPRAAFDPVDFPRVLPTLVLYEFVEDDAVRLRLVGTEITQAWGCDHTGDRLHEFLEGDYHDFIRGQIDECRAERVPVFSHSRFQWDRGRAVDTRRLLLPYSRDDDPQEIGFVLLSQVFDYGKTGPREPLTHSGTEFSFRELQHEILSTERGDRSAPAP